MYVFVVQQTGDTTRDVDALMHSIEASGRNFARVLTAGMKVNVEEVDGKIQVGVVDPMN